MGNEASTPSTDAGEMNELRNKADVWSEQVTAEAKGTSESTPSIAVDRDRELSTSDPVETSTVAVAPKTLMSSSQESVKSDDDMSWLQPAIELWVGRALRAIERANQGNTGDPLPVENFEFRLASEAKKCKKLRPGDIPSAKTYTKETVNGLRQDPRLCWQKCENGIAYWASKDKPVIPKQSEIANSIPSKTDLSLVQGRIAALVARDSPLDACKLTLLYNDQYHEILDYKRLGYPKMRALLDTIPSIGQYAGESGGPLLLVLRTEPHHASRTKLESKSATRETAKSSATDEEMTGPTGRSDGDVTSEETPPPILPASQSFYEFATKTGVDVQSHPNSTPRHNEGSVDNSNQSRAKPRMELKETAGTCSTGDSHLSIGDQTAASSFQEMALLGYMESNQEETSPESVFINTHIPFCMAAIGVQGAGKSHTLGCVLESCLLSGKTENVIHLKKPMTALVLHYDQSTMSVCEAAGLLSPSPESPMGNSVPRSKAVVLVSPTYYKQRKAFYGDYCTVRPLLFKWSSLTADHIKRVMRIGTDDNQLYVASFMTLLRGYQRRCVVPDFTQFIEEVKEVCNVKGQSGPLDQRIALLEAIVAESEVNKDILGESMDLSKALSSELNLIIVDMTDPLLSKEEANSLFQVVTEQFRSIPVQGGKLLALDEAHKFMDGVKNDGLSEAIVNVARLMRHDGIRLAVSTQSPKALAPELLELVSIAMFHHFHSQDWWTYIRQKLPVRDDAFEDVLNLAPGNALVFASRHSFASHLMRVCVRQRLTTDFGASRTNK